MLKVDFVCETDGKGLWSKEKKLVRIRKLDLNNRHQESSFGELAAVFDKRSWNTQKHGLIYTDRFWINEFREQLVKLGFTKKAARDVDYSEQGMQGDDYVSMDVGQVFLSEWDKMMGLDSDAATC
jgi:hypothetical protein